MGWNARCGLTAIATPWERCLASPSGHKHGQAWSRYGAVRSALNRDSCCESALCSCRKTTSAVVWHRYRFAVGHDVTLAVTTPSGRRRRAAVVRGGLGALCGGRRALLVWGFLGKLPTRREGATRPLVVRLLSWRGGPLASTLRGRASSRGQWGGLGAKLRRGWCSCRGWCVGLVVRARRLRARRVQLRGRRLLGGDRIHPRLRRARCVGLLPADRATRVVLGWVSVRRCCARVRGCVPGWWCALRARLLLVERGLRLRCCCCGRVGGASRCRGGSRNMGRLRWLCRRGRG